MSWQHHFISAYRDGIFGNFVNTLSIYQRNELITDMYKRTYLRGATPIQLLGLLALSISSNLCASSTFDDENGARESKPRPPAISFSSLNKASGTVNEITSFKVHPSNISYFPTIAYRDGNLFTANVEGTKDAETLQLKTVLRKGVLSDSKWSWSEKLIANNTFIDPYHTQASVGLDSTGRVHVAYNMHNMPWQYKVSEKPYDIENFVFRGEEISDSALERIAYQNKTYFPNVSESAIPGSQVTYPAFFNDRKNKLYVTYRYATKPKQPSFLERGFAGGIAALDEKDGSWNAIGGEVLQTRDDVLYSGDEDAHYTKPFAYRPVTSVYYMRMWFDKSNEMHLTWSWRVGGSGEEVSDLSYAHSVDGVNFYKTSGERYDLPVSMAKAEKINGTASNQRFYATTSTSTDFSGNPYITIQPNGGHWLTYKYDKKLSRWLEPEESVFNASAILTDDDGNDYAFSPGLEIHAKPRNGEWKQLYSNKYNKQSVQYCHPKVLNVPEERKFFVHAFECENSESVMLLQVNWLD